MNTLNKDLLDAVEKFDQGNLFIDVSAQSNGDVSDTLPDLAAVLDWCSSIRPFNGKSYREYLMQNDLSFEWRYLKVSQSERATLTNGKPGTSDVLTVSEFLDLLFPNDQRAKAFDSIFD